MNRLFNIFIISLFSAALFHFISGSFSYIASNWILDNAVWPDQKSYVWTLKMGYWLSAGYFVPTLFSALILLRQKYAVLSAQTALYIYAISSVVFGLFVGWTTAADFNFEIERWSFVLIMLSPLWLFLLHLTILKVARRAHS